MNRRLIFFSALFILIAGGLAWWLFLRDSGPSVETAAYTTTFDEPGTWTVGDDATATGSVRDGVYEMTIEESGDIFWVTGGRHFGDAVYQVSATPVEGVLDNGYGLLFRVDNENGKFYIFKVSSDGFAYIGRCEDSCSETAALVERDWFAFAGVNQGLNVTNILRVEANGPDMVFYINDTEVGRAADTEIAAGDIGLVAETFAPGGLRVEFDDFSVTPINE